MGYYTCDMKWQNWQVTCSWRAPDGAEHVRTRTERATSGGHAIYRVERRIRTNVPGATIHESYIGCVR